MTNNFNYFNQLANYNYYKIAAAALDRNLSMSSETKVIPDKSLFQYEKPNNKMPFYDTCKIYKKKTTTTILKYGFLAIFMFS
tara:strand:+ start:164 stop:409 length:246 start_codon:yes stop_codon:yes gene_type:complete